MRRFVIKFSLFVSPVLIYLILFFWLDPYNRFCDENRNQVLKMESQIAYRLNYPLYKLSSISRRNVDVLFLGDSRVNLLSDDLLNTYLGPNVLNLAYGGGTIEESIESFWIAIEGNQISEVFFGVNFERYNAVLKRNRVSEAKQIIEDWRSSIFNKYAIKSIVLMAYSKITDKEIVIEKKERNKEKFWEHQLKSSAAIYFNSYRYPKEEYIALEKMVKYCNLNNIKVKFFIPPTHIDFQKRIGDFDLLDEQKTFVHDLEFLAPVVNMNTTNLFTKDKTKFTDPLHFDKMSDTIVLESILGENMNPIFNPF